MRGGSVPSRNVYESSNNPVGYIGITHSFGQGSAFLKDDPCIFALPVWGGGAMNQQVQMGICLVQEMVK